MRCQATGMPGWMSCSCHCQGNQQKSITCTSRQIITWQMSNLTMRSGKTQSRCGIILQRRIVNLATERALSASSRGSPMPQKFRCNSHAKHPSIKLRSPGNKTCLAFGCIVAVQTCIRVSRGIHRRGAPER